MPMGWHKRLIVFILAADIGALFAVDADFFHVVPRWLSRYGLYLSGDLPTGFEIWAVFLLLVFGVLVGASLVLAPGILPTLPTFLPPKKHSKHHRSATQLFAYACAVIIECVLLGTLLGFAGKFLATQLFLFTASAGKTALVLFGLLGIIYLIFGLGEFGYFKQMSWFAKLYYRIEQSIARFSGTPYHFFLGLLSAGGLGVGCPYPIFLAYFLLIVAVGNGTLGALAMLCFAIGRLSPVLLLIFLKLRRRDPDTVLAQAKRLGPKIRYINGVTLIVLGSFMFVFWWIYASLSAFLYD